MTIQLTQACRIGGVEQPVGTQLTLDRAEEQSLITRKMAIDLTPVANDVDVKARLNPATGGNKILDSKGNDLLLSVGLREYLRACFPCNQSGTASNLPKDYSARSVTPNYGVNLATPWAAAGYLQSPGGSNQHIDLIPLSEFSPDIFVDSWDVVFTVNKAAPASDEGFIGNGASSTNRGFYCVAKATTGKLSVLLNTNTGLQTLIAASTATVFDGTDHQVRIGCNAQTKMLYLWIDGVLDSSAAFTCTASVMPVAPLTIGRAGAAGNAVAVKVYGVSALLYPSRPMPINSDDLSAMLFRAKRAPGMSADLQAFF